MRVTPLSTEECVKTIPNEFEMILVAAERARELLKGAVPKVTIDDNTPTFRSVALKEIAEGKIGKEYLTKKGK